MSGIGKRIKEIRRLANQTQSEFSQKIGIDRTHVSNLENDRANLSISLRKLICAEYGINEKWLLEGTGSMYGDNKASNSSLELLKDIIQGVEEAIEEMGLKVRPDKKAGLIILLYEDLLEKTHSQKSDVKNTKEKVFRHLRLVA